MELTPQNARRAVRLAHDMSKFGYGYLAAGTFRTDDPLKQMMLLEYFTQAQAHYDGTIHLITTKHALSRTACLQMRALFECWINMALISSVDDETWAKYLKVVSERQRIKYARAIKSENLDVVTQEANQVIKSFGKPITFDDFDIFRPKKANAKPRDFYKDKPLTIKEKCLLLNHYRMHEPGTDFEETYNVVYKSLSSVAHLEPYANASVFEDKGDSAHADISGNPKEAVLVMKFCFMFYSNSLDILAHGYNDSVEVRAKRLHDRFRSLYSHD